MNIVLTLEDLAGFSQQTRDELLRHVTDTVGGLPAARPVAAPEHRENYDDIHLSNVEDLTYKQIQIWMDRLPGYAREGVRIIAEQGPVVSAGMLTDAGISIRQFQNATTRRTRKLTGERSSYFLGWNHWRDLGDPENKYAVTPITHQSLRRYFGLPV